jgi:MFS family permease
MGAAGGVLTLLLIKLLVTKSEEGTTNYIPVYIAIAVIMVLAVFLLLLKIRETKFASEAKELEENYAQSEGDASKETNKNTTRNQKAAMQPQVKKSFLCLLASIFLWFAAYNAVTSAFSRYVIEVWDLGDTGFANFLMVAMAAAIVSYIPIGIISSHIGRKKTVLIGIVMITTSYALGCLFVQYSPLIYLVFILTGFGWAAINVNSYPMIVEMSRGGNIGTYTGYYYSVSMAAQVITPIFSGFLLEHVSYYTLFPYAVLFSVGSFLTMLLVKHGDVKPLKKKSALENFDVED